MDKKTLLSLLLIGLAVVAAVGGTLAWFTAEDSVEDNVFTAGTVQISADGEIISGAEKIDRWNPGDSVEKVFTIENTGNKAIALRGAVEGKWDFEFTGDDAAVIIDKTDPSWNVGADGYYYYGETLEAGETATLHLEVNLDGELADNQYQGHDYTLSAGFQAIQASHADEWQWDDFGDYN
ncbi:MAG: TasA family protein [Dethiobacteria bacterium]|jgi:predicted ribosomally synthesized peptide with SipW-like signal peptide